MNRFIAVALGSIAILGLCLYLFFAPDGTKNKSAQPAAPLQSAAVQKSVSQPADIQSAGVPKFSPRDREKLAFHFAMQSQADFRMALLVPNAAQDNGALSHYSVTASGEMAVIYFAQRPGQWSAVVRTEWNDYRINGTQPQFFTALNTIFMFQMDRFGTLSHFQFKTGLDDSARDVLKQLILSMQVVLPENASERSWTTTEIDADGFYSAVYTITDTSTGVGTMTLSKSKDRYYSFENSDLKKNPRLEISIDKSSGEITLPNNPSWISSIHLREAKSSYKRGERLGNSSSSFDASRTTSNLSLPETLGEARNFLNSKDLLVSKYYQTDPEMNLLARGLDMRGAIDLFSKLWISKDEQKRELAERFMVNYLRLFPKQSSSYVQFLDQNRPAWMDESVELRMWHFLTKAGHLEAQLAMSEVLNSSVYGDLSRYRALANLHYFEYPQEQSVANIQRFIDSLDRQSGAKADEMRAMAYYALGTSGAHDKLNQDLQGQVRRQLASALAASSSTGDQSIILQAIGNQGDSSMLTTVAPYLTAQDTKVRSNAYEALRRMPGEEAVDLLLDSLTKESSESVRVAALKTLCSMPKRAAAVDWAQQTLPQTVSTAEQEILVELLGKSLDSRPDNEAALRHFLEKNPGRNVKQMIYKYIRPQ